MRNIAAYLLLQAGGNQSPTAADIKKLLGTVGIDTDDERLENLISELKGKSTGELIAEGSNKLASVPSGGGGGSGGGGSAVVAAAAAGGGAAVVEEKKEEKAEEKEESDEDMGFGLFD